MAVVKEIHYPGGGITRIHDDAYRDATPEEMARRIKRASDVFWSIIIAAGAYEIVDPEK